MESISKIQWMHVCYKEHERHRYVYSHALFEAQAEDSVCFEGLSPPKLSEADSQNRKVMQYY